jgi:hypothetical protein
MTFKKKSFILLLLIAVFSITGFRYYNEVRCYFGTEYPASFSSVKFANVEVGMNENEVVKLVGLPYGKSYWERVYGNKIPKTFDYSMIYYKPIDWEHHFVKMINMKEGKVVKIISECNCE